MPFIECRPSDLRVGPPPRESWRQGLAQLATLPAFILFNMFPALARALTTCTTTRVECDGWLAEWETPRFVCPNCGARVGRLDLHNVPYPVPVAWRIDSVCCGSRIRATAAGVFMVYEGAWRRGHWERSAVITRDEFGPQDESRGWYHTEFFSLRDGRPTSQFFVGDPVFRKAGTPRTWCLIDDRDPCWVDPLRLDEALSNQAVSSPP